jgi:cyclophilin family peptidyl-prolyl cis-trans isomerase
MFAQSFRVVISLAAVISLSCLVAGCGGDPESPAPAANISAGSSPVEAGTSAAGADPTATGTPTGDAPLPVEVNLFPEVIFTTSEGTFKVKLNREKAPITVENFLFNYVDTGYYDNTIFHKVEQGFMALGGAYQADLSAKATRAEIFNEAHNGLKNQRGTIAMSRDPSFPHTASNGFFFNLVDNPGLDHLSRESTEDYGYCVFGEVVEGLEVLDRIAQVQVEDRDGFTALPVKTVLIQSVRQVR